MRLAPKKVRQLTRLRGESLTSLLKRAGVSRTAYYSLLRRETLLPRTVLSLSAALETTPGEILEEDPSDVAPGYKQRLRKARRILESSPEATFENIWHTLCLLELGPVERLNRSLIRGRATAVHR